MPKALGQAEIDQFQNAISSGDFNVEDCTKVTDQKKIRIYDFKRPDRFSKAVLRALSSIHETFSRLAMVSLSGLLQREASVYVISVDQLTYEEFIRGIPNPTALAIIEVSSLQGFVIWEVNPSATFEVLDRVMGGPGRSSPPHRAVTEIEQSVIEGIIETLLTDWQKAWELVVDLQPCLRQFEVNPQFAQVVSPTEMTSLVTLEIHIGDVESLMNIAIPFPTLEPIIGILANQEMLGSIETSDRHPRLGDVGVMLGRMEFPVVVGHDLPSLTLVELRLLKSGSLLALPASHEAMPFWEVGGVRLLPNNEEMLRTPVVEQRIPTPRFFHRRESSKALGDEAPLLKKATHELVAIVLKQETLQTIALTLTVLEPSVASEFLESLPLKRRAEILHRLKGINMVDHQVMDRITLILGRKLRVYSKEGFISLNGLDLAQALQESLRK